MSGISLVPKLGTSSKWQKEDLIIYMTEDGLTKIERAFDGDMVWLPGAQMAEFSRATS